ncbi:MAG: PQQ-binding-like beta-propeller repeat protein [Planctomycetota bacterium]
MDIPTPGRRFFPRAGIAPVLALILAVLLSAPASAEWPQFRGPNRDGKAETEQDLLDEWPDGGPPQVWVNDDLGRGFGSASVTEDYIYTTGREGERGYIYALDHDGTLRWKTEYGRAWTDSHPGTRCTPTVHDGRLYIMSGHALAGCFDAETGEEVWTVDTQERFGARQISWGITENVLVMDERAIFTPGGKDAGVVALDPETGETQWVCGEIDDKSGYCSPILIRRGGMKFIVQLMATTMVGIEAETGRLLWQVERQPEPAYDIQAVPPVYEEGMLFVTSGDGGRREQMFRLSPDGTEVSRGWDGARLDVLHGGVILHEGRIYGASNDNYTGDWFCLDLRTGQLEARIRRAGRAGLAFADGLLYGYGYRGRMMLIDPDPDSFRVISSFRITKGSGPHWAHPSISGDRLYLRHGRYMFAFDIGAD